MIRNRRARDQHTVTVEAWGPEPIGASQVDAMLARRGADLAAVGIGTPPGWGLPGSVEVTDTTAWAAPQAFTGLAGLSALRTFTPGGGTPVVDTPHGDAVLVYRPTPQGN